MIVSVTLADSREAEIAGALLSVVDHVDRILVVDTGVVDRTLERARAVAGDRLVVTRHTWVDFSAARNAGLDAARDLGATWVVIVDSDERLALGAPRALRRAVARTVADVLLVESDDGAYAKDRVVRASSAARFVGPTHETLLGGGLREVLPGATFYELPKTDVALKSKCERDVAILTERVTGDPDPRWWFYLGQSYAGLGQRDRAIAAYAECIRRRVTGPEAALAALRQAEQFCALEQFDAAIASAARGLAADASFAECAVVAAQAAQKLARRDQAVAWARIAEAVGRYRGCGVHRRFFRDPPALYEQPYEILATALPDEEGRAAAAVDARAAKFARLGVATERDLDRLSVSRAAPVAAREDARAALRPSPLSASCPSARSVPIRFRPPAGWHPTNPGLARHGGEIWCVVRAVNYLIVGGKYVVGDPDGTVRTENYLGTLRPDGELVGAKRVRDLDPAPRRPKAQVVGYEDVRLVSVRGRGGAVLAGSATVCDRDPDGRPLIARLTFRGSDVRRATLQPSNQICEKNWMPISIRGEFAWVYSVDPTAILPGPLSACPLALDHLRGGAATSLGGGYMCVMHEVVSTPVARVYLHRFVRLSRRLSVTAVSPAWVFDHHGIEFCAGVVRDGDDLVLSYGVEDCEARVLRVRVKDVKRMDWITA